MTLPSRRMARIPISPQPWALLLSVVLTTLYTVGVPKAYVSPESICVYQGRHYQQKRFDARYARELVRQIPDDASVCAASMFVPHLALREKIEDYDSKQTIEAEYVFGNRDDFEVVSTDGVLYLFRRIRP